MIKSAVRGALRRIGVDIVRAGVPWHGTPVRDEMASLTGDELRVARLVEPFTATSLARVVALIRAVRYVVQNDIPGSFVECGVWRGGSMMAIALTLRELGVSNRDLFLFDTFEGMTEPSEFDRDASGRLAGDIMRHFVAADGAWVYAGLEEVRRNLASTGYSEANIHFIKGRVEQTIPHPHLSHIALLRLDTDWYDSTRHELLHLHPLVSSAGVVIVDDYGDWQGARKAVDEFMLSMRQTSPILLHEVDRTGRLFVKVR